MVLVSNKGLVDDNLLVQLKLETYEKQWVHFYSQLKYNTYDIMILSSGEGYNLFLRHKTEVHVHFTQIVYMVSNYMHKANLRAAVCNYKTLHLVLFLKYT
jgi:hypothetical protein